MSAFQAVDSVVPAVLVGVVALAIAAWSWQTTVKIMGLVLLVVILPLSYFIKDSPESMGLTMDGDPPGGSQDPPRSPTIRRTNASISISTSDKMASPPPTGVPGPCLLPMRPATVCAA